MKQKCHLAAMMKTIIWLYKYNTCVKLFRYFDIFKRVYLLGFVTQNESALFDLFNLSDPCFVNSYFIPWLTLNFFLKFYLILTHVSEYRP